jgi:hypothetical protein
MTKSCPQCQCGLYEVLLGKDGEPAKIECNMCGAAFPVNVPRTLTLNQAGLLGDLIRGVERGLKLRYYPFGTRDADHPMVQVMRAFTYEGGNLYPHNADVRDAYVWTSGFMEHWFKVDDLITALDNMDGKHGLEEPIATIDEDKEK